MREAFTRGGEVTELDNGWFINMDKQFELRYYLYHYCDTYHLFTDLKYMVCSGCGARPPAHILGYLDMCRNMCRE